MIDVVIYPVAESGRVNVLFGKRLADKLSKPYPIPGVRVTGGVHGPGGETLYACAPIESKVGALVALELPALLAGDAGKTITVDGVAEAIPAKQTIDEATWAKTDAASGMKSTSTKTSAPVTK